jgi:hypothetical protein
MFRQSLFASFGAVALFIACSDNNNQKAPLAEAGPVCPQSPKDAVGKACSQEGYSCAVGYLCPAAVWQQAHCTCTMGKYACVDATNQDIAAGTDPVCAPVPPPSEKCGGTPADITKKMCSTAGYACYYPGVTCPNENNGKQYTDDCVCAPYGKMTDGGPNVLAWNCTVHVCGM